MANDLLNLTSDRATSVVIFSAFSTSINDLKIQFVYCSYGCITRKTLIVMSVTTRRSLEQTRYTIISHGWRIFLQYNLELYLRGGLPSTVFTASFFEVFVAPLKLQIIKSSRSTLWPSLPRLNSYPMTILQSTFYSTSCAHTLSITTKQLPTALE